MTKSFGLTGVAGYIAPRHLKAIKETGNNLIAALDPHDSVGIIDSFFPGASFFTEFERFDRFIEKTRHENNGKAIDYLSICSPNYLHDAHIRFAMRVGADAICEKPLVINPWNCDALEELEEKSGQKIYNVLQLRVHPAIRALREKIAQEKSGKKHEVNLTYITSRGAWYLYSWKGREDRSGGLIYNIGIHFFDMLLWIFGGVEDSKILLREDRKVAGTLELEKAKVNWFLSIDKEDLPDMAKKDKKTTFRSITVDGEEIEFSDGFTDLHTEVYKEILAGNGFRINDAKPSIEIVHDLRYKDISPEDSEHKILRTK
ncbi:MAG: Gfo/Idh/MocA family protein [Planctomycetota bacterium]|jgi:UDP-N-acetyl-2-amino-2-deoxyglucuronate dehydrogenase